MFQNGARHSARKVPGEWSTPKVLLSIANSCISQRTAIGDGPSPGITPKLGKVLGQVKEDGGIGNKCAKITGAIYRLQGHDLGEEALSKCR